MALTADNSGRVTTQPANPSGNSLPPELTQLIAERRAQAAAAAGGGGGPTIRINLGGPSTRQVRLEGRGWRTVKTDPRQTFSTIDEAINSWFLMDDKYRESLMEKMYYYGLIDGPNDEKSALGAWGNAIQMAAGYQSAGKDVDPTDMFQRMTNLKAGQLGNQPRTVTSRSFSKLDPATAKVWIRQAFQASMGRDPHDAEIRQLIGKLQQGFGARPAVTQQTVDANGNTTTRQIDAGFDPEAYIANQMNADPEAAAHQAADTYYPALLQALASPV